MQSISPERNPLTKSSNWADLLDEVDPVQDIPAEKIPLPYPVVKTTAKTDDRIDAPVIWIKRTFGLTSGELKKSVLDAFEKAGVPDVEIVEMYVSFSTTKQHAYMILSSLRHSELLLDGTISVLVESKEEVTSEEDIYLWFEKADHLEPRENQDPYMLYVWQLPTSEPATLVHEKLESFISRLAPIVTILVPANPEGLCLGWAKIEFDYQFYTQKCVYMLNFNHFMGTEIRAVFCNADWKSQAPKAPSTKSRQPNPRSNNSGPVKNLKKLKPSSRTPPPKPVVANPTPKTAPKSDDGWGTVTRRKK